MSATAASCSSMVQPNCRPRSRRSARTSGCSTPSTRRSPRTTCWNWGPGRPLVTSTSHITNPIVRMFHPQLGAVCRFTTRATRTEAIRVLLVEALNRRGCSSRRPRQRRRQPAVLRLRAMPDQLAALPRPRESFTLLCARCGSSLFYVRQDRARGVLEHHFACRRCGQKHAAWSGWDPHRTQVLG